MKVESSIFFCIQLNVVVEDLVGLLEFSKPNYSYFYLLPLIMLSYCQVDIEYLLMSSAAVVG
jgi:hypothetical protein